MIVLTFNPNGLEDYKEDMDIIHVDAAVLEVTGFELPVMFCVNNVNLFEITKKQVVVNNSKNQFSEPVIKNIISSWLSMPILNFAINGLEAVKKVYMGMSIDFVLPEVGSRLIFQSIGGKVEIYSGINQKTAITDSHELLWAFENFLVEVRDSLRREVPQLLLHPYWGSWLVKE